MAVRIFALACLLGAICVSAQSYGGDYFTYQAELLPRLPNDIQTTSGLAKVRTQGDTLFFEATLNDAVDITAVHLHLEPDTDVIDGGPLVLALTNTTDNPLSSNGGPLVQSGSRTTQDLLANPQLEAARQKLAERGVTDNTLQNIGDIDRLLAAGFIYGDVHSIERPSPTVVVRGPYVPIEGRRLRRLSFAV